LRIFLDECVDRRPALNLIGHDVRTARDMGWTTIVNGGSGNSRTGLRDSQGLDFARLGRSLENDRFRDKPCTAGR